MKNVLFCTYILAWSDIYKNFLKKERKLFLSDITELKSFVSLGYYGLVAQLE